MKKRTKASLSLRERLRNGEIVAGPWCVVPSPDIAEIIGLAGMDFLIIDMEHGPHSPETLVSMVRAAGSTGCSPLVRVCGNDECGILHALDAGAHGVLVPHIETREDAEQAIAHARYHPEGSRGFSPFTRAGGYAPEDVAGHCRAGNERTMLGLILEGEGGTRELDSILSLPDLEARVHLIYIGAYDLSQALGVPGQVDHPGVWRRMEDCIRKIRARGIAAGGYVARNQDDVQRMCAAGMQFITFLPDCTLIHQAFGEKFREFRAALRPGGE